MQERTEAHPLYTLGLPPAYPRKTAAIQAIPHTLSSGSPPRPNCFCWPCSLRSHSTSLQSLTGSGGGCVGLTVGYVGSCPVCPKSLRFLNKTEQHISPLRSELSDIPPVPLHNHSRRQQLGRVAFAPPTTNVRAVCTTSCQVAVDSLMILVPSVKLCTTSLYHHHAIRIMIVLSITQKTLWTS